MIEMTPGEAEKKVVKGAVQILKNPECFCKGTWYRWIDPRSGRTTELEVQDEEAYNDLKNHLATEGGTLANPNFRVCGEGAIYVSAALQGYDYDQALGVILEIESNGGCGIQSLNDADETSHMDVAKYIGAYGDMDLEGKGEL